MSNKSDLIRQLSDVMAERDLLAAHVQETMRPLQRKKSPNHRHVVFYFLNSGETRYGYHWESHISSPVKISIHKMGFRTAGHAQAALKIALAANNITLREKGGK